MGKIIVIANQKGGVGKTTVCFHLAHALSSQGRRVLAVDNDPQGNLTGIVLEGRGAKLPPRAHTQRLYTEETIEAMSGDSYDLLGANATLAAVSSKRLFQTVQTVQNSLASLANNYDFVLVDCLPGLGALLFSALAAARAVLIPVRPSKFGLAGAEGVVELIERAKQSVNERLELLGVLLNLVDPRCVVIERDYENALRRRFGEQLLQTRLHRRIGYEESATLGKAIHEYSRGADAQEFALFTEEFLRRAAQLP